MTTFRYQIYDLLTGDNEGDVPYRFPGRALERLQWLNVSAGHTRYSLRPVRVREPS